MFTIQMTYTTIMAVTKDIIRINDDMRYRVNMKIGDNPNNAINGVDIKAVLYSIFLYIGAN